MRGEPFLAYSPRAGLLYGSGDAGGPGWAEPAFGQDAYWDYHHVVCHNLAFALLMSVVFAAFSVHRMTGFILYLALAHLHLVLDYFGSGPGWPIHYGWPVANWTWVNPNGWEFSSWQNRVVAGVFLLWVLAIALVQGRTPVELLTPDLDRRIVNRLRSLVGFKSAQQTPVP